MTVLIVVTVYVYTIAIFTPKFYFVYKCVQCTGVPSSFSSCLAIWPLYCSYTLVGVFHSVERLSTFVCLSVLSRFWCTRLLFSQPATLPPPLCTLHFDSFLVEDPAKCCQLPTPHARAFVSPFHLGSIPIVVHVSLRRTLFAPPGFCLFESILLGFLLGFSSSSEFNSLFSLFSTLGPDSPWPYLLRFLEGLLDFLVGTLT